jgi:hypothetical protein
MIISSLEDGVQLQLIAIAVAIEFRSKSNPAKEKGVETTIRTGLSSLTQWNGMPCDAMQPQADF